MYKLLTNYDNIATITLSTAIKLTYEDQTLIPKEIIMNEIMSIRMKFSENYGGCYVMGVSIRAYFQGIIDRDNVQNPSKDDCNNILKDIFLKRDSINDIQNVASWKTTKKNRYTPFIKKIQPSKKPKVSPRKFMVGDIETLPYEIGYDDVKSHVPYAAGYMMVSLGEQVPNKSDIFTFYADDYKYVLDDFLSRSTKMLYDMISRIITDVNKERRSLVMYFHNLARFDGIIILRHIVLHHKNLRVKTIIRNNSIYEIVVYTAMNRLIFKFHDSLLLIPGSLKDLGDCLCPELGSKGSMDHEKVTVDNLGINKDEYTLYLEQDILLLGGVMKKAQEI